jgi:hypothetical protein
MKRSILVILIVLCILPASYGQQLWKMKRWEAVGGIGPSFFFGDIGGFTIGKNILGFKDMSFHQTMFDLNGSVKFRILRDLNVRLSLTYGMLHGTDVRGTNVDRAFAFTTSIFEPAVIGEYCFIKNYAETSWLFMKRRQGFFSTLIKSLDVYAFTGFGGVSYSVRGNDALVAHGMTKSGFSAVIPAGLGATMIYSPDFNFGLEIGGRYTFTDYLDGYTSQYSKANDVYYFLNLTVTYKLKTGPHGWPSFR